MSARRLLLINPNSAMATTTMMVAIAQGAAGEAFEVVGATATRAPPMILHPQALAASATEVVEIGMANQGGTDGIIVAAFGDPGLAQLRDRSAVPVVGIAEAAMLEAAQGGRRFGIATTTSALAAAIAAKVHELGLAGSYAGIRITKGDPHFLVADPTRLQTALAEAVNECISLDHAEAVIIGGGPLGQAAAGLQSLMSCHVIAPIQAAVRRITNIIASHGPPSLHHKDLD